MLEKKVTLEKLVTQAERELIRLGYSKSSIARKKSEWKKFVNYSKQSGTKYFSSELVILYLKKFYNYPDDEKTKHSGSVNSVANSIRKLSDMNLHGRFLGREKKKFIHVVGAFADSIRVYEEYCLKRNNQLITIHDNKMILDAFFEYLIQNKVSKPSKITSLHLSQYASSQVGYSKRTFQNMTAILRGYFKSLFFAGIIETDLSEKVPTLRFPREDKVPTIWKTEDIEKMIKSIDRGSPYGKRDYAIILLVSTYGLRDSDVRKLKLENIKWSSNTIVFTQSKTGQKLSLPLCENVGLSIIEYLKYGRPVSDSDCIFIKHTAPYTGMEKAGNIITKYIRLARIPIAKNKPHGIHTLRHTLASRMLENNVPLNTISAVLGHIDPASSKTYMHFDIEKLRACALEVGEQYE